MECVRAHYYHKYIRTHLMRVEGVIAEVNLQGTGLTHPGGWEDVHVLRAVNSSLWALFLAVNT